MGRGERRGVRGVRRAVRGGGEGRKERRREGGERRVEGTRGTGAQVRILRSLSVNTGSEGNGDRMRWEGERE